MLPKYRSWSKFHMKTAIAVEDAYQKSKHKFTYYAKHYTKERQTRYEFELASDPMVQVNKRTGRSRAIRRNELGWYTLVYIQHHSKSNPLVVSIAWS